MSQLRRPARGMRRYAVMCALRYEGLRLSSRRGRRRVRYEERLVLVEARSEADAWDRAGKACGGDTFRTAEDSITFVGVEDVLEVGLLVLEPQPPGLDEVYCRFLARRPRVIRRPTRKGGW
ncbi:MAG: hypothetical protein U0229_01400 [Anaeromyxobacter sp.]